MPVFMQRIQIIMEDGKTWTVTVDQRDLAHYERQDFYARDRVNLQVRFIAWSASARQGLTKLAWPKFDEDCIQAGDEDGDEDEELDPTKPAAPGES